MPLLMCPNCEEGMREIDRYGVRIDVCPKCRGVWLDRGELEKILAAAAGSAALGGAPAEPTATVRQQPAAHGHHAYRKKKRRSFLDDLFDFDFFD